MNQYLDDYQYYFAKQSGVAHREQEGAGADGRGSDGEQVHVPIWTSSETSCASTTTRSTSPSGWISGSDCSVMLYVAACQPPAGRSSRSAGGVPRRGSRIAETTAGRPRGSVPAGCHVAALQRGDGDGFSLASVRTISSSPPSRSRSDAIGPRTQCLGQHRSFLPQARRVERGDRRSARALATPCAT